MPRIHDVTVNKTHVRKLLTFSDTDAGNAEAFALLHGRRFRYNHSAGKWFVWNGRLWCPDDNGEAERAALNTARSRRAAAATIKEREIAEPRIDWALYSEANRAREALLKSGRSIKSLATTAGQFDREPFLMTVSNGTINLINGNILPASPSHLITRATQVIHDPEAHAPRWEQFLEEIFSSDLEMISYVRRAVGYSLTADTREQCFFILFGTGANGKSTFVEILSKLLGTYAETAEFSTFLSRRNQGAPRNDLAKLNGARLVKAAESEYNAPLNESLIKEVTGQDTIAARFLFREHFSFRPNFKIWLVSNHKPDIRGTDHAIWRRVRLIPFEAQFDGARRDSRLHEKLEAELPGILNWAIEGCLAWQRHGLGDAPRITQATLAYRQDSDQFGRFLKDHCILAKPLTSSAQSLFDAYVVWCREHSEKAEANIQFARRFAERGITKKRTSHGFVYQGIGLAPVAAATAATETPASTDSG